MRVLVACEFSGIVRDAFRDRGHDAWPVSAISYYQSPADPVSCEMYGVACHQPGWIVALGFMFGLASLAAITLPVGSER